MDNPNHSSRPVAIWLMAGAAMIVVQVLLGGITRLTGSGLSITEWKPLLGAIPPLDEPSWQQAFHQYKQIGQFKQLNFDFTLSDFKFIYFWEWFHRLWARLMALAFAVPFVIFLVQKRFNRKMVMPMLILFLLGGLQGAIGWLMVKSGLNEENLYVNHIRLAIHFIAAMVLLCYAWWFALRLLVPGKEYVSHPRFRQYTVVVIGILVLQLIYGAFMAGLKAGVFAPTWPLINGSLWPAGMGSGRGLSNLVNNPITVQFIHRNLAYALALLVFVWDQQARGLRVGGNWFRASRFIPLLLVLLQVVLGVLTVLYAPDKHLLLALGVAHQFTGMLLLLAMVWMLLLQTAPAAKGESPQHQ
jgi:cytochrome c oxidase assembly protein subunit 15